MSVSSQDRSHQNSWQISDCKKDFPLFQTSILGSTLHYLDNAATTQKPASVIDAISGCYAHQYGPTHRGIYPLAEAATSAYENARKTLADFIGSPTPHQVIFTRSATEAINMVASAWMLPRLNPGDRIWVSRMEHHSNFLPWQRICQVSGAELRIIELHEDGTLNLEDANGLFDKQSRLITLCHVSNVLGIENPIRNICEKAQAAKIPVFIDAAQSVGHQAIDVQTLGCDFLAFSAHKMYGPSGIGTLYGKLERLEEMEPALLGGGMVDEVYDTHSTWVPIPQRFEAGSPNLAGAIGFSAAADYLSKIGLKQIQAHMSHLTRDAIQKLPLLKGIRLFPDQNTVRASIVSFDVEGIHPHDLAQVAGENGVAIRAGHHCCQPLMHYLGVTGTARASFGLYNQPEDVDALVLALEKAIKFFA